MYITYKLSKYTYACKHIDNISYRPITNRLLLHSNIAGNTETIAGINVSTIERNKNNPLFFLPSYFGVIPLYLNKKEMRFIIASIKKIKLKEMLREGYHATTT